ncbi:hypothetical protein FACS1894169_15420 [Bacteroidia bacterium]|nr:hypothetical protein FACS1894169_15420 [Bacteroidia bacterium]
MAFGQLNKATGNEEYAEIARKTFDIILSKVNNPRGKWNKAHTGEVEQGMRKGGMIK